MKKCLLFLLLGATCVAVATPKKDESTVKTDPRIPKSFFRTMQAKKIYRFSVPEFKEYCVDNGERVGMTLGRSVGRMTGAALAGGLTFGACVGGVRSLTFFTRLASRVRVSKCMLGGAVIYVLRQFYADHKETIDFLSEQAYQSILVELRKERNWELIEQLLDVNNSF